MKIEKEIQKVLDYLDKINVKYESFFHEEVFTVEDVKNLPVEIPGRGVKTLFLRDRKGKKFYLLSVWDEKEKVDLRDLAFRLGKKKLIFATDENLAEKLMVKSGSISPLALMSDLRVG